MNATPSSILTMTIRKPGKYTPVSVLDKDGQPIPHLKMRNGVYYCEVEVQRKRYLRRSPYQSLAQSAAWVRKFVTEARSGRWEALESTKARSAYVKLEALFEAYRLAAVQQLAVDGKPAASTVENNIGQVRNILGKVRGVTALQDVGVEVLTRELVETYVVAEVQSAGKDLHLQKRKRLTAASSVRQAKSLFTRWARGYYETHGIKLPPSVNGFLAASKTSKRDKYQLPPLELRTATAEAAAKLKADGNSGCFLAYLLCYNLGLRAGEAVAVEKSWFETDAAGAVALHVCRRTNWQPKNRKARRIPVAPEVWADLQERCRLDDPFVLPGGNKTNRKRLVNRTFAAWMRGLGWDRMRWPKAAHELRKLAGSVWYTKAGLQWAATWLGDTPETVYHYYADATELGPRVEM